MFTEDPSNINQDPYLESNNFKNENKFNYDQKNDPYEYNTHDPFIQLFDRMFKNMQYEFFKNAFLDSEEFENDNDPFYNLFANRDGYPHHHSFNHSHGHPNIDQDFDEGAFSKRSHHHGEHFHPGNSEIHRHHHRDFENIPEKEIKFRESKIYDV